MYTQFFGNYLLANGYVTQEQLFSAMRRQADKHIKLGTIAMHAGYMTASEVDTVYIRQTQELKIIRLNTVPRTNWLIWIC